MQITGFKAFSDLEEGACVCVCLSWVLNKLGYQCVFIGRPSQLVELFNKVMIHM